MKIRRRSLVLLFGIGATIALVATVLRSQTVPHRSTTVAKDDGSGELDSDIQSRPQDVLMIPSIRIGSESENTVADFDETNDPAVDYEHETRDFHWAATMETELERQFSIDELVQDGLEDLKIELIDCRQNTCRLQYQYPTALLDIVAKAGLTSPSPLALLEERQGPPAPRAGGANCARSLLGDQEFERCSIVFGFDRESRDTLNYANWRKEQLPAVQAAFARMRESWNGEGVVSTNAEEASRLP